MLHLWTNYANCNCSLCQAVYFIACCVCILLIVYMYSMPIKCAFKAADTGLIVGVQRLIVSSYSSAFHIIAQ